MLVTYRTYQYVDSNVWYTEDYIVGFGGDFETYNDFIDCMEEGIGLMYDGYEIECLEVNYGKN